VAQASFRTSGTRTVPYVELDLRAPKGPRPSKLPLKVWSSMVRHWIPGSPSGHFVCCAKPTATTNVAWRLNVQAFRSTV